MNDLQSIWEKRFFHYLKEAQRYAQFIFTGHLVIVFVFAIGAIGFAYSEWLKIVPGDFPSVFVVSLLLACGFLYGTPTTLLQEADRVFLLPLEKKIPQYMKKAFRWTYLSQLPIPLLLYVVALPLLHATQAATTAMFIWLACFLVILKWVFVDHDFTLQYAKAGEGIWQDRIIRFILSFSFVFVWLSPYYYLILIPVIGIALYSVYLHKATANKAFPYEHFIQVEQNRMMRFYRLANYFTDVPHLKGAVKRRSYLSFLMRPAKFGNNSSQYFLLKRTLIRTDDIFFLWVRLTTITMIGAYFLSIPLVIYIFAAALSYASSIQLIYALRAGNEFRMDMLFPESRDSREQAIAKLVRLAQSLQALFVTIVTAIAFKFSLPVLLVFVIILLVSEITIRSAKVKVS